MGRESLGVGDRVQAGATLKHSYFAEIGRNFIVFNDQPLSFEPITDADIERVTVKAPPSLRSAAWSSDCDWFFIITRNAIYLFSVQSEKGYRCNKKSARFVEAFLQAPLRMRPRRGGKP